MLGRLALVLYVLGAERALGFKLIVRVASEPKIADGRFPASGKGFDMIELETFARGTSLA